MCFQEHNQGLKEGDYAARFFSTKQFYNSVKVKCCYPSFPISVMSPLAFINPTLLPLTFSSCVISRFQQN